MKKNNKKGFTIVELVIVIAVIAILAAVLIPTFSNVTEKAKRSAALQECRNEMTDIKLVYAMLGKDIPEDTIFERDGYYFIYKDGSLQETKEPATGYATKMKNVNVYTTDKTYVGFGKVDFEAFSDCITIKGFTNEISNAKITVWNDNGEVILEYVEEGPFRTTVAFDIYDVNVDGHMSGNRDGLTSAAPKTNEQAYNRYYIYTISGDDGVSLSGIFYYAFNGEAVVLKPVA